MIKTMIAATFVAVIAVMAGVVAYRLSADALAMIVGVVLGLMALIPTLILAMLMLRRGQRETEEPPRPMYQPQPPVVVVSGGMPMNAMPQGQPMQNALPAPGTIPAPPMQAPRRFRMMGYEATEATDVQAEYEAF